MLERIVHSKEPVVLLGAGRCSQALLRSGLDHASRLVCADGGANHAVAFGLQPEAVIGDMDSLDAATRDALPPERVHQIDEQDSTDFDKALFHISAPLVLCYGFEGDRADHWLAACNTLVRRADQACVLVGQDQLICHVPPKMQLDLTVGQLVSLFPMARVTGRSHGLRWPIDGIEFAPDGRIGTSNAAAEAKVTLHMDGPGMLLILPTRNLTDVITALRAVPALWPAHAG